MRRKVFCGGRLILEGRDDLDLAGGRFALEGSAEGSTCATTTESPDLTIPVRALGSAYLGGVSLSQLAAAGLVDEHRPGALALADRMFASQTGPSYPGHLFLIAGTSHKETDDPTSPLIWGCDAPAGTLSNICVGLSR